jgi:uncharacterized repeat protein (TIGR02543 family)
MIILLKKGIKRTFPYLIPPGVGQIQLSGGTIIDGHRTGWSMADDCTTANCSDMEVFDLVNIYWQNKIFAASPDIPISNVGRRAFVGIIPSVTMSLKGGGINFGMAFFDVDGRPGYLVFDEWRKAGCPLDTNTTPTQQTLTITLPTNSKITSSVGNIDCGNGGNSCSASYQTNTSLTLTATPASGYQFSGWTGSCSGTNNPVTIIMDTSKTCTANVNPVGVSTYTLTTSVNPSEGGSIKCNNDTCSPSYASGSTVSLTAHPVSGYKFDGWTNCSTITTTALSIRMDTNKTCTAKFSKITTETCPAPIDANASVSTTANGVGFSISPVAKDDETGIHKLWIKEGESSATLTLTSETEHANYVWLVGLNNDISDIFTCTESTTLPETGTCARMTGEQTKTLIFNSPSGDYTVKLSDGAHISSALKFAVINEPESYTYSQYEWYGKQERAAGYAEGTVQFEACKTDITSATCGLLDSLATQYSNTNSEFRKVLEQYVIQPAMTKAKSETLAAVLSIVEIENVLNTNLPILKLPVVKFNNECYTLEAFLDNTAKFSPLYRENNGVLVTDVGKAWDAILSKNKISCP